MDFKIEDKGGRVEVRCEGGKATCFFENTPKVDGKNIGTIGEFEADSVSAGVSILKKCEEVLRGKGFKFIVSPMNGNTWKKYRVMSYTSGEPEFVFEKVNPIEHNEMLQKAGFEVLHKYISTKGKIDDYVESKFLDKLEEKMKKQNIVIRNFDKNNYLDDLAKIYNVARSSFGRNPFYTEISKEEFLKQYEPYISMFDEELILIAEKEGKPVGFLFAVPNYDKKSIVVKTGAVLIEYEKIALGSIILGNLQKKAKAKGYEEWIFAFMYQNNTSVKSAKRHKTEVIREYVVYGKMCS